MENFTPRKVLHESNFTKITIAFDNSIKREVAIKELLEDKMSARFYQEAMITGQLEHPGIVPVYELKTGAGGKPFYAMKYVHGETLYQKILKTRGPFKEEAFRDRISLLNNLIAVCEAVGYAHSKGVVHRDLKPGNIVVGEFGETILIDWGLAKIYNDGGQESSSFTLIGDGKNENLTRSEQILGTPSYMAPEQVNPRQFGKIGPWTDVYSLGVILFMLLTGEKPYRGETKKIIEQIEIPLPSPSARHCGDFVPPELATICEKAMAKNKDERFQNATELANELKAYRDGRIVSAYAYSKKELLKRFIAKNKTAVIAATAVIGAIIAGSAFAVHFAVEATSAKLRAEHALKDITALSSSAAELAKKSSLEIESYFVKLENSMGTEPTEKLKKLYPEAVFLQEAASEKEGKIIIRGNRDGHTVFAEIKPEKLILSAISFDPVISNFQVWCMDENGVIIYDEDPKQIGLSLFTDKMYAKYPELLKFGEHMKIRPSGISYYSFLGGTHGRVVHKIAAWETVERNRWKFVVTYPYVSE